MATESNNTASKVLAIVLHVAFFVVITAGTAFSEASWPFITSLEFLVFISLTAGFVVGFHQYLKYLQMPQAVIEFYFLMVGAAAASGALSGVTIYEKWHVAAVIIASAIIISILLYTSPTQQTPEQS